MEDKAYVEEIKRTKKMKRKFEDYMNYFIFMFPIGFVFIGFSMVFAYFKHHSESQLLLISLIPISIGLLLAYFTSKRLNNNITFEAIENKSKLDLNNLKIAIENNFRTNDIQIDEKTGSIEVLTKLTGLSWGERITIIQDKNTYLVNSRPSGINQPVTIYKDRKNINKIRKILIE